MNKKFNIYTKTGDDGTTGLLGGTRVKKYELRLEAYGTVDELNSWIGVLSSGNLEPRVCEVLFSIQNKLFVIGSHLATDESKAGVKPPLPCSAESIDMLEKEIDRMQEMLPALTNFVLPGGSLYSGYAHVARTVCRRAERKIVELNENVKIQENVIIFINRLSDYLFVLSRYINLKEGKKETLWIKEKK